jgi:hypothetical protein
MIGITPAEHTAVAKDHELGGEGKTHRAPGWGSERERSSPITR